jgi:hypothetical protein
MRALLVLWRYTLTNALLIAFIAALASGSHWIWVALALAILIGGAADEVVGDDAVPLNQRRQLFLDANLYAALPLVASMTYFLFALLAQDDSTPGYRPIIAAVIGTGYFYAVAGVTAAHELTHRISNSIAFFWSKMLLAFIVNPTFEMSHVYGHHRNVGTYNDPSTARRGEYVLAFILRTTIDQWIEGWLLETQRLRRKGHRVWSWHNRVLAGLFCSAFIVIAAASISGSIGILAFLLAAVFGRIFYELSVYTQHYGIVRVEGAPIEPRHSWDSHRLISNVLYYNSPLHSDHHMLPLKPFWQHDARGDSPKLPYGYQTMALMSFFPGLWRKVIDPLLDDWDRRLANEAEKSLIRERGWALDVPPVHKATPNWGMDRWQ